MAELLGVVASGIGIASLVIQVFDSITKIKSFCNAMKEVPEEIQYLIEEIEALGLVLDDISSMHSKDECDSRSFDKCISLCRRGADILDTAVKEMSSQIEKQKRIGAFKAVMKRGQVEKLRERLRSAQFLLMLSHQAYSETLQRRRHELQRQWAETHQLQASELHKAISQAASPQTIPDSEHTALEYSLSNFSTVSKLSKKFSLRYRMPYWLVRNSWIIELCGSQRLSCWTFTLRTYNFVPLKSLVIDVAANKSVCEMQKLFEEKQASPFDMVDTKFGLWTILDFAIWGHQYEMCEFLMNQGANQSYARNCSALNFACQFGSMTDLRGTRPDHLLKMVRLFSREVNFDDPSEDPIRRGLRSEFRFTGDPEALKWLLEQSPYARQKLDTTEFMTMWFGTCNIPMQTNLASLFRVVLGERKVVASMLKVKDGADLTLLHQTAFCLGERNAIYQERPDTPKLSQPQYTEFENLVSLIDEILSTGADIHDLTSRSTTPMLEVFRGFMAGSRSQEWYRGQFKINGTVSIACVEIALRTWLQRLKSSGIDLVAYGRKEQRLQRKVKVLKELYFYRWKYFEHEDTWYSKISRQRLISFAYGAEPEDWRFFVTEVDDYACSEFWDMVGHPERAMPGAWND